MGRRPCCAGRTAEPLPEASPDMVDLPHPVRHPLEGSVSTAIPRVTFHPRFDPSYPAPVVDARERTLRNVQNTSRRSSPKRSSTPPIAPSHPIPRPGPVAASVPVPAAAGVAAGGVVPDPAPVAGAVVVAVVAAGLVVAVVAVVAAVVVVEAGATSDPKRMVPMEPSLASSP